MGAQNPLLSKPPALEGYSMQLRCFMGPKVLKLLAAHSPSPGNSLSFGTGTFVIEFHITGAGL